MNKICCRCLPHGTDVCDVCGQVHNGQCAKVGKCQISMYCTEPCTLPCKFVNQNLLQAEQEISYTCTMLCAGIICAHYHASALSCMSSITF